MGNTYHDARGRFTNRNGQLANIAAAISRQDWAGYEAEKRALQDVDQARGFKEDIVSRNGITEAFTTAPAELIERDRLIAEGTIPEIESFIQERTARPEFVKLLSERDKARQLAKDLKAEYDFMAANADKHPELDYEDVRSKGFQLLETYENLQILKEQTNTYKDLTAPAVARLSELTEEKQLAEGVYRSYDEETLNDLVRIGDFPSGSREWLESRQGGIGGSDVGKIIGAYGAKYATRDYEEVLASKVAPITDEEVEAQAGGHTEFAGPTGRGNAWEEAIAYRFAENNPDINLVHCKGSWARKDDPTQRINFDGLLADKDGNIDGVLEIKTGADASKWGKTTDGLDGVPSGYRAQVLHYAYNGGLSRGAVAVILDDHEYREYHFQMTPELQAEAEANYVKGKIFWGKVEAARNGVTVAVPSTTANKGFPKSALNSGVSGDKERIFREASVYREESIEETRERYKALCPAEDRGNPEKVLNALQSLYTEHDPAKNRRKIIAIDLETTSGSPTSGRIIEVGVSVRKPAGGEEEKFSKLYGLSKKSLAATGTGPVEVHQITSGMIAKKRQFSHPEEQKALLDKLKQGTLLAHNASFEIRWLKLHLDGFADALKKGEIKFLDTMPLTKKFHPDTADNRLSSFVGEYGIKYENAHRAYNDAAMMAEAYESFRHDIHSRQVKK